MKAVFVHQNSLLRDSHISPESAEADWQMMPATIEAVRLLADEETLIILYCSQTRAVTDDGDAPRSSSPLVRVARQLQAGGGRVDGLVDCSDLSTGVDSTSSGLIWAATSRYGLRPELCYLLGDGPADVATALEAGVRPLVVLGDRHIDQVFGRAEIERDFPVTSDLGTAIRYIGVEEEIARQLGSPRSESVPTPVDLLLPANATLLPTVTSVSEVAKSLEEKTGRNRVERRDIARWLFLFSAGALGLSLGVAYLLTDLYREQPFPEFVYYLTLQFIPRQLRGMLFIVGGAGIIALAVRSMVQGALLRGWLGGGKRFTE